jgi:hypothetical protein
MTWLTPREPEGLCKYSYILSLPRYHPRPSLPQEWKCCRGSSRQVVSFFPWWSRHRKPHDRIAAMAHLELRRCFPTLTKRLINHRIDVRIRFIQFGSLWRWLIRALPQTVVRLQPRQTLAPARSETDGNCIQLSGLIVRIFGTLLDFSSHSLLFE